MEPKRIRELRVAHGWTQDIFAELLGLETRGAVSKLESGAKKPTGPVLRLLFILEKNPKIFANGVDYGKQ